jgi:hypothetical protein
LNDRGVRARNPASELRHAGALFETADLVQRFRQYGEHGVEGFAGILNLHRVLLEVVFAG